MSRVIRISESTFKRLESLARGFDTPGNVIERLLDSYVRSNKRALLPSISTKKRSSPEGRRLPRGLKTPAKAFYRPILKALVDLGGKARVHEVLVKVESTMKSSLSKVDHEPVSSNPNEARWANTAKWARKDMTMVMKPPLLKPDSAKGIWEITEAGRRFLEEVNRKP